MSNIDKMLQEALYASLEGSNLPVPRSVDLESALGEIESEIEALYEERQEAVEVIGTSAVMESYLCLLEQQSSFGDIPPASIYAVQLGFESLFDKVPFDISFESIGLESDNPDVGKFRQFVDKLKAFIRKRTEEIELKIRIIKQKIFPSVKGTARIVADIQRVVDRMDPSLTVSSDIVFGSSDLDFEKLDLGTGRIETPSEIVQRYHSALIHLEETWSPDFRTRYGSVIESWKALEVDSIANFRKSIAEFLIKHPPLMEFNGKNGLIESFDNVGLHVLTNDPATLRLRNKWVSDNNQNEQRLVAFINDADAYFVPKISSTQIRYQTVSVLGRVEMQALLSTMAEDLKYLAEHERALSYSTDPAFDQDPDDRLGAFSNLSSGQRYLFNDFSAAVYYVSSVTWDYQTDLLFKMLRAHTALIRLIQLSIKSHKNP